MVHWKIVVKTCPIILMIAYGLRTHIFDTHFLSYKENNEIRTLFINKIINFSLFYAWQCINKHADIQEELMESWCLLSHDILFKLLNYRVNVWNDYYYMNKVSCHEHSSNNFIAIHSTITYLCIRYDLVIHHDVVIISLTNTHEKIVLSRGNAEVI